MGNDLAAAWVSQQIQPLQARVTPMWLYSGSDDPTKIDSEDLDEDGFPNKKMHLTMVRENLHRKGPVPPYSATHLPPQVCFD